MSKFKVSEILYVEHYVEAVSIDGALDLHHRRGYKFDKLIDSDIINITELVDEPE